MKVSEIIQNADMKPVTRGKNLRRMGWWAGYMPVAFGAKPDVWIYGPGIPEEERDKIHRVPYPDKIFTTNIKNKYRAYKVEKAA